MNCKCNFIRIEEILRDLSANLLTVTTSLESASDDEIQSLFGVWHALKYVAEDLSEAIENI